MDEEQAQAFINEFGPPSLVFNFWCKPEILRERMQERNNYNDTTDTIGNKHKVFYELSRPVLQKYNAIRINCEKVKDEVFRDVEEILVRELGLKVVEH